MSEVDQTITMNIPGEELSTNTPQSTTEPESTSNPQPDVWEGPTDTPEYTAWLQSHLPKKSPPVPGAGRKCEYCKNKEKINMIMTDYLKKFQDVGSEKLKIPFLQELAMILKRNKETMHIWAYNKTKEGEYEHPEFHEQYEQLMNIQELRLLQRTLGRYNPTGAIFQLKTNHGYMETEKKVLSGDTNEPLVIELISEKPKYEENE